MALPGKRPAAAAPGVQPDDFAWLLHLFLLAAGSEPDPAEPGAPVMAVTTRPAAILMVRGLNSTAGYSCARARAVLLNFDVYGSIALISDA